MSISDKLALIAENELKVYNAGYEKGKAEGGDTEAAYEQGVADGKQAEYDAFWDVYQLNGTRINYQYAFGNSLWKNETFRPKYNIVLGSGYSGTNMFHSCTVTDLTAALEKQGVILDTSNNGVFTSMFQKANCKRIPPINLSRSHEYGSSLSYLFANSTVETIDKLIVTENTTFSSTSFQGCASLISVTFEGIIGKNGLNLQWSTNLSRDSIINVVMHLSDDTSGLSVTLSKAAVDEAFKVLPGEMDGSEVVEEDAVIGSDSQAWNNLIASRANWTINLV